MSIDKSIKILVAEDEYLVSEDIIRGLKMKGYTNIIDASNGQEAYEMTCKLGPDLILMDIKMPKLDGIEAARRIQKSRPTPIVIITAHESRDIIVKARDAGVSAFLTKPPEYNAIENAMVVALARHADLMEVRRLNRELEQALSEVKRLRGILPICSSCKKIRNDEGYWEQVETYIADHSEAEFTHGICPECFRKIYPEDYQDISDDPPKG